MGKIKDLTGQRFGRLIALSYVGKNKENRALWLCQCDCGNTKTTMSKSLISGKTQSCGCIHNEQLITRSKKHGLRYTKLYGVWCGIKSRCFNENDKNYKYYGGRGITMYDEWKNDFQSFYNWAICNGYEENLSIDRVDNNSGYTPSNCRWITHYEQVRNQRSNHLISYNGETLCLTDMAIKYGINPKVLSHRLKYGWSIGRALTEPVHKRK